MRRVEVSSGVEPSGTLPLDYWSRGTKEGEPFSSFSTPLPFLPFTEVWVGPNVTHVSG